MEQRKLFIHTFGCQMNVNDSQRMMTVLGEAGYSPVERAEEADLIIVNTCSIREKAKQKAFSHLGRYRRLKKSNPKLIIAMGGCLAEQMGEEVFDHAPQVSFIFGTRNLHRLREFVRAAETGKKRGIHLTPEEDYIQALDGIGIKPEGVSAYVTIMQGCNNYCAFCVVPYLRGPEVSRDSGSIIREITDLVGQGVKEVTLLGQNVNSYGKTGGDGNFSGLLRKISLIEGLERIRFATSHPKDLSDELINLFGELDKLCPHIHLPVQSGSNRVLSLMNRGYTREEYLLKVKRLREVCPEISITSDVIVGFPGEGEEDFAETINLMKEVRFDSLFSFKYSEREGTAALHLPDKVEEKVRAERLRILQALQEEHTWEKNRAWEGRYVEVLVESVSKNSPDDLSGRSRDNRIVNFKGPEKLIGSLVEVFVTRAYPHSLRGELRR